MNKREERLRFLAEGAQNRVSSRLGDIWWAFMLRGVFAGVLGICALIWPTLSFTILTRLVGLYLLADGLPWLMGASRASASGTYILQAIVSLVAGGVLLFLAQRIRPNPTHGLARLGALHRGQPHPGRLPGKG
jgi:uncharacterized membrane protein HdeD (DUF308 family)